MNKKYKPLHEVTEIKDIFVSDVTCRNEGVVDDDFDKMWTIRFKMNGECHIIQRAIDEDVSDWHIYNKLSPAKHLDLIIQMMGRIAWVHKWGDREEPSPNFEKSTYYQLYHKLINISVEDYTKIHKNLVSLQPIKIVDENTIKYNSEIYKKQ